MNRDDFLFLSFFILWTWYFLLTAMGSEVIHRKRYNFLLKHPKLRFLTISPDKLMDEDRIRDTRIVAMVATAVGALATAAYIYGIFMR